MPLPVPVPAPPPEPLPCDSVGGPAGASIAPGSEFCASARFLAGMFSCSIGFGSFVTSLGGSSFGGFSTGTVILSLPGSSAFRGGSFILLPPPPPPPPGPGSLNQMISLLGRSGRSATAWVAGLYRLARTNKAAIRISRTIVTPIEAVRRFGSRSNENLISGGWSPSMWTDRWPADVLDCAAAFGMMSAIVDDTERPEIFSRTSLPGGNCKRGTPYVFAVLLGLTKGTYGRNPGKSAERPLP